MPSNSRGLLALLAVLATTAVAAAAAVTAQAGPATLRVAVTVPILAPMAEAVGGQYVSVESLVPSGVNPHAFEPKPSLAAQLSSYSLIVMTGPRHLKLEDAILEWRVEGLARGPAILYYENYTSCGLRLLRLGGRENPHGYWWGPRSLAVIARCVGDALARVDPTHAAYYEARASLYASQAEALAGRLQGLRVAAYSPAAQYFVEESGARLVYIAAPGPDAEPSPTAAGTVEELYRNGSIDVFVETYVDKAMSRAAGQLAEQLRGAGVPVAVLPLGEPGLDPLTSIAEAQGAVLEAASHPAAPQASPGGAGQHTPPWGVAVASFMAGLVAGVAWWRVRA
jgi:ABC-type Zn uptake system ZnuABC Zn-binding protein ZnuA